MSIATTIPTWRHAEHDPRLRGLTFGTTWREQIVRTFDGYARLFEAAGLSAQRQRTLAAAAFDEVVGWAPALAEEIAAIADGAALELWQVAALNARRAAGGRSRGARRVLDLRGRAAGRRPAADGARRGTGTTTCATAR